MIAAPPAESRALKTEGLECDFVVVGGGLAGTCAAITAARAGLKVVLVQDRPVLGGNASSEVRLWILGATSHMGNNNRWAREGGVIDELLVENLYRNPEGNPVMMDALMLEWAAKEPNLQVLLNTVVHEVDKQSSDTIRAVRAFCSQNSTAYELRAPLFCDASGDGIVGYLAGAAFRMGAEGRAEFGEGLAPLTPSSELLGHTIYFYSKDTGRPVSFVAPAFALKDIKKIPRWRDIRAGDSGCRFWWLEWGGDMDTIHQAEEIKWELWRVVYGVWDYIKNSGDFPEAANYTLEWVGAIPGKRESRRFEGDYLLTQQDIIEQRRHPDAVSYGGWAIDLHPPQGVYSPLSPCSQWHAKGVYQIPFRALYSRNLTNLFLAGRLISASHVAFASTRVMATCAHGAQAVGMAAAVCLKGRLNPRELVLPGPMAVLQRELLRAGQFIPGVPLNDPEDIAQEAAITASSQLRLGRLVPNGEKLPLNDSWGMMLPVSAGPMPSIEFIVDVSRTATLRAELRVSSKPDNHTPEITLAALDLPLVTGANQKIVLNFSATITAPCYAFVVLLRNDDVAVHLSDQRVSGVLAITHNRNKSVAKSSTQSPPPDSGIDTFEFWTPKRRPSGKNFALGIEPPLDAFGTANLKNGFLRPTSQPNAWVADFAQEQPFLRLTWRAPKTIARIELCFDTDFDHPMESVLMGHPERVTPFCVRGIRIATPVEAAIPAGKVSEKLARNGDGFGESNTRQLLFQFEDNHHSRLTVTLDQPVTTSCLELSLVAPSSDVPVALFDVRCYET